MLLAQIISDALHSNEATREERWLAGLTNNYSVLTKTELQAIYEAAQGQRTLEIQDLAFMINNDEHAGIRLTNQAKLFARSHSNFFQLSDHALTLTIPLPEKHWELVPDPEYWEEFRGLEEVPGPEAWEEFPALEEVPDLEWK